MRERLLGVGLLVSECASPLSKPSPFEEKTSPVAAVAVGETLGTLGGDWLEELKAPDGRGAGGQPDGMWGHDLP